VIRVERVGGNLWMENDTVKIGVKKYSKHGLERMCSSSLGNSSWSG